MEMIPAIIFWALALFALFWPRPFFIYLFFCAAPFGGFAAVPVEWTLGSTVLPQAVAAAILILRTIIGPQNTPRAWKIATDLKRGGLLTLFVVFAIITGFFFPRLFTDVLVVPMRGTFRLTEPLMPTTANLTQSLYLLLDLLTLLGLCVFMSGSQGRQNRQIVLRGVVAGGIVLAATGVLDFLSPYLGLRPFLSLFRTASYGFIVDAQILGMRRIVGLYSEAAAFGAATVTWAAMLMFIRPAMPSRLWRNVVLPVTAFVLLALAAGSTSSTAYLGLFAFCVVAVFNFGQRAIVNRSVVGLRLEIVLLFLAVVYVGVLIATMPEVVSAFSDILNTMLFRKAESSSYVQRNSWNETAWQAFFGTHGLGVGVGGARTSNWIVSVLSNTGVIGGALLGGFIVLNLSRKASTGDKVSAVVLRGAKSAYVVSLLMATASATVIDPGLTFSVLMALMMVSARSGAGQRRSISGGPDGQLVDAGHPSVSAEA